MRQYAPPFRISDASFVPGGAAPAQGANSVEVLREAGLDEPAIAALVASGVVRAAPRAPGRPTKQYG
jgi:crotonobetainyl-CoA:carnitine CoA-transferase CaiB-like acyl-CoA transferase